MLDIYKASAGSGKTTNLVLKYLLLLFNSSNDGYFKHIVAVTFTNKATNEMKSRILEELNKIANGEASFYLDKIIDNTGKSKQDIVFDAGNILKKIVHNYDYFSIITIDKFFQDIVRNFTRELGINANYKVELGTKKILKESINNLIKSIENNNDLKEYLIEIVTNNIEEEKSHRIKDDIEKIGNEVFKESFYLDNSINVDRKYLKELRKKLKIIKKDFEDELDNISTNALDIIKNNRLEFTDFSGGINSFINVFRKISKDNNKYEINNTIIKVLNNEKTWYSKTQQDGIKKKIDCAKEEGLENLLNETVNIIGGERGQIYFSATEVLKNISILGLISNLQEELNKYKRDNNILPLTDAGRLIYSMISKDLDSDFSPFIYEKIGNYFNHFFIDEFQDTSVVQWNNFKPLIMESLATGNYNMIVGDVKQSVYRWRNGDWQLLHGKVSQDVGNERVEVKELANNYRSSREVIEFNNSLFSALVELDYSGILDEQSVSELKAIYGDVNQEVVNKDKKGEVLVKFLEKEDYNLEIIKEIERLQDKGLKASDIAILVRNNKDTKKILETIEIYKNSNEQQEKYNYNIISEEAFKITNYPSVCLIINILKYIKNNKDDINKLELLNNWNLLNDMDTNVGDLSKFVKSADIKGFNACLPFEFTANKDELSKLSLIELVNNIVSIFNLANKDGGSLNSFFDIIIDFSSNNGGNLLDFIDYWEEDGKNRYIPSNSGLDAMQLLTIHKAKGLEFEAVVIPYCNWSINPKSNEILWSSSEKEPFKRIKFPLKSVGDLEKTVFANDYKLEKKLTFVDNINLLYVAFTRAKRCLSIFCELDKRKEKKINQVNYLLENIIKSNNFSLKNNFENNVFAFGNAVNIDIVKKEIENSLILEKNISNNFSIKDKLRISKNSDAYFNSEPRILGKIMHSILQNIYSVEDIDLSINKAQISGMINEKEGQELKDAIKSKIEQDKEVILWFSGDYKVLTEQEIINKAGEIKRPDRILIKDNKAKVIDFKFSKKTSEYDMKQVKEYANLLTEMGFVEVECFVWYVNQLVVIS